MKPIPLSSFAAPEVPQSPDADFSKAYEASIEEVVEQEATQQPNRGRKLSTAIALASVVVSSTVIVHSVRDIMEDRSADLDMSVGEPYVLPVTQTLPEAPTGANLPPDIGRVFVDARNALTVDTCDTKVTPNQVVSMYQRLFGEETAPSENPSVLQDQTMRNIERLEAASNNLSFGEFPLDDYNRLYADAISERPVVPLSEYQRALKGYLPQIGLEPFFDWESDMEGVPDEDVIEPIDNDKTNTDNMARRAMADILGGFAYMPKEFVTESGARRVFFGDLHDEGALGEVHLADKENIMIDTSMFTNDRVEDLAYNDSVMQVIGVHESTHLLHQNLCWTVMEDNVGVDNAMRFLNNGAIYQDDLKNPDTAQTTYTLEVDGAGSIISTRPYGMTNVMEDVATEGETIFYGPNARDLYGLDGAPGRDLIPVREKYALLLARLDEQNPALAEYYVNFLQAGRIHASTDENVFPIWGQMNEIIAQTPDLFLLPANDSLRQTYQELEAAVAPYDQVRMQLETVLNRVGNHQ